MSKSFDNGMVCASEQAVIIDKEVYDEFPVEEFKIISHLLVNKKKKFLEDSCSVWKLTAKLQVLN